MNGIPFVAGDIVRVDGEGEPRSVISVNLDARTAAVAGLGEVSMSRLASATPALPSAEELRGAAAKFDGASALARSARADLEAADGPDFAAAGRKVAAAAGVAALGLVEDVLPVLLRWAAGAIVSRLEPKIGAGS